MPLHPDDLARLVREDHIKANTVFERLEAGTGNRAGLLAGLVHDVSLHAGGEENVFYDALRKELPDGGDIADADFAEHQRVKDALVVIDKGDADDPGVETALATVIEVIRRHAREEEAEQLPRLRLAIGDEKMQELGRAYRKAKAHGPTHPHPHAPTAPIIEAVASAPAALLDKVKDKLGKKSTMFASDGSGLLDPQAQELIDAFAALGPQPVELLEPEVARKQPTIADAVRSVLEARGESTDPEPVELVQDRTIPGIDGDLLCRLYVPVSDAPGRLPLVVYVHGGGWVLADLDVYDATPRALANQVGAVVVSVEYRHAPEHPFPAAHDDVTTALRFVMEHAAQLGGDPERIAIVGESAGANMAIAATLTLKQAGLPLPSAQVLVYPVASAEQTDSYVDSADAVPLNTAMMTWFQSHTFASPADGKDPRIDLVNVPLDAFAGLPATMVVTAERDPLRVEGQQLAQRLREAGVEVEHLHVDGVSHEFFGCGAVLDKAADAVGQAASFLSARIGVDRVIGIR